MAIWFMTPTLAQANDRNTRSLVSHLDIRFEEIGDDYIKASMPVDERTIQGYGILHGGASVALAETLGSYAATFCVDSGNYQCFGLEINANHIRPATSGRVSGVAKPIHLGKRTQVWRIEIRDEQSRLICASRLTMAVVEKKELG